MHAFRWFAVVVLLGPSAASAQAVVAGQVVLRGVRTPVRNVLAELVNRSDSVVATMVSAADGTFSLPAPAAGTFRVRLTPPDGDPQISDSIVVAEAEYVAREFSVDPGARALLEFQVDFPATPLSGGMPRYPDALRQDGISGCVLAQFVIDTKGVVDTTTFKVIRVSRIEFAQAVRAALPRMRFRPAEKDGRPVRQLAQVPYNFSVNAGQPFESTRTSPSEPARAVMTPVPPPPKPAMCGG